MVWRYFDDPQLKRGDVVMTTRSYKPSFLWRRYCELCLLFIGIARWRRMRGKVRRFSRADGRVFAERID